MTDTPGQPNTAVLNDLLTSAFMDERDLRRFCRDTPEFQPVLEFVSAGAGLQEHVDVLIKYCETQLLFDELLAGVKEHTPRQYAHFAPLLGDSASVRHQDSATPRQLKDPPTGIRKVLSPLFFRKVRRVLPGIIGGLLGWRLTPVILDNLPFMLRVDSYGPLALVGAILGAAIGWWFWKKLADMEIVEW